MALQGISPGSVRRVVKRAVNPIQWMGLRKISEEDGNVGSQCD